MLIGILFAAACIAPLADSLFSSPTALAATCTPITRLLYRGATDATTGGQVSELQRFLRDKGYFSFGVTGYFGLATEGALKQFQRRYGIVSSGNPATTGYGATGSRTRAKIQALSGCVPRSASSSSAPSGPLAQHTPASSPSQTASSPQNQLPSGMSVTCTPSATTIALNQTVTWSVAVSGGPTIFSYAWDGTDGLIANSSSFQKTYTKYGPKTATITLNRLYTVQCPTVVVSVDATSGLIPSSVPQNTNSPSNPNQPNQPVVGPNGQMSFDLYRDRSFDTYADHAIAWFTIGGATSYEPYRKVLFQSDTPPANFWSSYFGPGSRWNGNAILSRGFQRVLVHNPFGHSPFVTHSDGCTDGGMVFDQYLNAQTETPWLTNDFVSYWKPYVDSGLEVIAYIGSLDEVDNLDNASCAQIALQNNSSAYWTRAFQAIQPFLDAGMSIGLDASVATNNASFTYQMAQRLRAMGVRVYVESIPTRTNPHWAEFPFIIDNDLWWFSTQPWAMPLSSMKSDIYRFIKYPVQDAEVGKQVMRDGYTASANTSVPLRQAIPDATTSSFTLVLGNSNSTYRIVTNARNGTVSQAGLAGTYTYTPASGFNGTDTFDFVATTNGTNAATTTVTLNVYAELPPVTAAQMMSAARQVSGGGKVVANWPLFQKEIDNLGIMSIVPSTMVPKRVITFQSGSSGVSYVAGYNKTTFAPMAVSAGRLLITEAGSGAGSQYAAVAQASAVGAIAPWDLFEWIAGRWQALIDFWVRTLF